MKKNIILTLLALAMTTWVTAQENPIHVAEYTLTITAAEDSLEELKAPAFTSNCDEGLLPSTYEDKLFSGGALGTMERTWILQDACGNEVRTVQYIKLEN